MLTSTMQDRGIEVQHNMQMSASNKEEKTNA
jgi:hypothetical protein